MLIKILYTIYNVVIFYPIFLIATLLTALIAAFGCMLGGQRIFSYYPGMLWSRLIMTLSLAPIKIIGKENIPHDRRCVVAANHQSAIDIWLLYGYMGIPFKWILRGTLRKVPFVGWACEKCGFIFVDNSTPERAAHAVPDAKEALNNGYHIFIFPEGTRSANGKLGRFKKGASKIALDTEAPILPVSINGAYDMLPKDATLWKPGKIKLIIHPLIESTDYDKDVRGLLKLSGDLRAAIAGGLDEKYL